MAQTSQRGLLSRVGRCISIITLLSRLSWESHGTRFSVTHDGELHVVKIKGNQQFTVNCACSSCMGGRGKGDCAVARSIVWERLVVLVVLTARLQLTW